MHFTIFWKLHKVDLDVVVMYTLVTFKKISLGVFESFFGF